MNVQIRRITEFSGLLITSIIYNIDLVYEAVIYKDDRKYPNILAAKS